MAIFFFVRYKIVFLPAKSMYISQISDTEYRYDIRRGSMDSRNNHSRRARLSINGARGLFLDKKSKSPPTHQISDILRCSLAFKLNSSCFPKPIPQISTLAPL